MYKMLTCVKFNMTFEEFAATPDFGIVMLHRISRTCWILGRSKQLSSLIMLCSCLKISLRNIRFSGAESERDLC